MDHCTAKPVTSKGARGRLRMEKLWTLCMCLYCMCIYVCETSSEALGRNTGLVKMSSECQLIAA